MSRNGSRGSGPARHLPPVERIGEFPQSVNNGSGAGLVLRSAADTAATRDALAHLRTPAGQAELRGNLDRLAADRTDNGAS